MTGQKENLISIIVPVYNVEPYLDKCITQIVNQTYTQLEIILVDDGSTDRSLEICRKYAGQDSRIKVISKRNGGSSSARNVGIEAATGEYIGFLDADDWAEVTMYEVLFQAMENPQCKIAQVMSRDYDELGNLLKDGYRLSGEMKLLSREEMFRLLMLHEGDSSFCTKLFRADFMKQYRFLENRLNEDFELILRMLPAVENVTSIEKAQYNILIRGGSNQRSGFSKTLYEAVIENSDKAQAMMKEWFPTCEKEAERFFFWQRLDFLLHIPTKLMKKDNACYQKVIKEVRDGKSLWQENDFLTPKEKKNLKILSICPRFSRQVHGILMKIKEIKRK